MIILPALALAQQDTVIYDREVLGRPFSLDEIVQQSGFNAQNVSPNGVPTWVVDGAIYSDTIYYGIGRSFVSQDAADDDARLRFAQHVEVSVQSIAIQKVKENKERLTDEYSFESLVSTNMNLSGVLITERYVSPDSTFHSLISYGRSEYHRMVTREIEITLETDIRQQVLAHKAKEAMRADSLRHKIKMDSLALSRKQAVIDSLDRILAMEEREQQQKEERIQLLKHRYASFLKIKPRYLLIDAPTASTPDSWFNMSGRWNPENSQTSEVTAGLSIWLLSMQASLQAHSNFINQGEFVAKLEVLPTVGEIYPINLALGWVQYYEIFAPENQIRLDETGLFNDMISHLRDEMQDPYAPGSSFFGVVTMGYPTLNSQFSFYMEKRKISLGAIWYPFPRHLGDAISVINQVDMISAKGFRNRFNDTFQWQVGLRLIAIQDRFATMITYEDHECWRLNFEFQY
ncbi:MAG: hypothetical protein K9M49_00730 [Candidatus Marinimicrobia bacterium]|nr:hypothetical protein [Candidatus Neomarinimicrobiota bacterium]MCF7850613.1 hypothetical protein [Candidatus Neomarinimicrobiota bacterium]MCF7903653.1 hypothetical protein [Candidatus Neomarinimicrobiota bacterium]